MMKVNDSSLVNFSPLLQIQEVESLPHTLINERGENRCKFSPHTESTLSFQSLGNSQNLCLARHNHIPPCWVWWNSVFENDKDDKRQVGEDEAGEKKRKREESVKGKSERGRERKRKREIRVWKLSERRREEEKEGNKSESWEGKRKRGRGGDDGLES